MAEPAIVLVEDDPSISDLVEAYLHQDGFAVQLATTGEVALAAVRDRDPVLVILDVGLPGGVDGFAVCRRIRATSAVPIVLLTARDDEVDRVLGLELGADDYVTKPFSPRELVARVRAILRRTDGSLAGDEDATDVLHAGEVEVDLRRREVRVHGTPVHLAARELDLLVHLAENQGLALTRRQLLDAVWGEGWVGDERTVDVHVRQLRKKLGDALPLATVRGMGYRLG
jgi:DNA-binding response OmpR family regulator